MMNESQPRLLVIAYQCEPNSGSVAMIGWQWVNHLAKRVPLQLITHARHREKLDPHIPERVTVHYVETESFAGPLYRISSKLFGRSQHVLFMVSSLDFLLFGRKVRRYCRRIGADRRFNLCHVVTPVSLVMPHRFGNMGLPTILGPLNGGMSTPPGFPEIMKAERGWLYRLRVLGRLFTYISGNYRHAKLVLAASESTERALGQGMSSKLVRLCENGVGEVASEMPAFPSFDRLELLFVGRLVPIKGLSLLLRAIARLERPSLRLQIVGNGPAEAELKRLARTLGIADRVLFQGYQLHEKVGEFYRNCHINLLPSIRESGGGTILEAMALGRPSIALNHGGPAEYITPDTGFLIDCGHGEQVIADLAELLAKLQVQSQLIRDKASACLEQVRPYRWSAKIDSVLTLYRRVAGEGWMP